MNYVYRKGAIVTWENNRRIVQFTVPKRALIRFSIEAAISSIF
jgi:hypothetical protein